MTHQVAVQMCKKDILNSYTKYSNKKNLYDNLISQLNYNNPKIASGLTNFVNDYEKNYKQANYHLTNAEWALNFNLDQFVQHPVNHANKTIIKVRDLIVECVDKINIHTGAMNMSLQGLTTLLGSINLKAIAPLFAVGVGLYALIHNAKPKQEIA